MSPLFEYQCYVCGYTFEELAKRVRPANSHDCPECSSKLEPMFGTMEPKIALPARTPERWSGKKREK